MISLGGASGSAPVCRAEDPGTNPGQGVNFSLRVNNIGPMDGQSENKIFMKYVHFVFSRRDYIINSVQHICMDIYDKLNKF